MAKGVRGSTPTREEQPVKTSIQLNPESLKQLRYVSFVKEVTISSIIQDALQEYFQKWEKKNGPIKK